MSNEVYDLKERLARAYLRLQCADVPREPWQKEVSEILFPTISNTQLNGRAIRRLVCVHNLTNNWRCDHGVSLNTGCVQCETYMRKNYNESEQ